MSELYYSDEESDRTYPYTYTFSLHPGNYEPTGTCNKGFYKPSGSANFSKIFSKPYYPKLDKDLQLDIIQTAKQIQREKWQQIFIPLYSKFDKYCITKEIINKYLLD